MPRIFLDLLSTNGMCDECIFQIEPDDTPDYYCKIFDEYKKTQMRLKECMKCAITEGSDIEDETVS